MADAHASERYEQQVAAGQDPESIDFMDAWRSARMVAAKVYDVYADALHALIPVVTEECPTMAVDEYFRCYINPEYVTKLISMAKSISSDNPCPRCGAKEHHPLAYLMGTVYHEVQHCLRKHHKRGRQFASNIGKDSFDNYRANVAQDMEIDDDFQTLTDECIKDHEKSNGRSYPRPCQHWEKVELPQNMGLPMNEVWEFYYDKIADYLDSRPTVHIHVSPDGESFYLGIPDDVKAGLSTEDIEFLEKQIAKKILDAKKRGYTALGDMIDWARERMPYSYYDWKKEFRHVRSAVGKEFGYQRRSFGKPHKKSSVTNYNVIYPSRFTPKPEVAVLLDTSGSMSWADRGVQALAELDKLIKQLRAQITLFCGDAEAYESQSISSLRDLRLKGGGGTSMRSCIKSIMPQLKKKNSKLLLLVTDGETDYPTKEEMQGVELIVCVINEYRDISCLHVPDFARSIWIPPNGQKVRCDD